MGRGQRGRRFHKTVKLVAVAADGSVMELYRFGEPDPLRFDPTTKVGKGLCSNTDCEQRAAFWTQRGRRKWGFCAGCAQLYAAGVSAWSPGMPVPEAVEPPPRRV